MAAKSTYSGSRIIAVSEFYSNNDLSNLTQNFMVSGMFEYGELKPKALVSVKEYTKSEEWLPGIVEKLSNKYYLSAYPSYSINRKNTELPLTKNEMHCTVIESVFFSLTNVDITETLNQYFIEYETEISSVLSTYFNIIPTKSDRLTIRQIGATFLGINYTGGEYESLTQI